MSVITLLKVYMLTILRANAFFKGSYLFQLGDLPKCLRRETELKSIMTSIDKRKCQI